MSFSRPLTELSRTVTTFFFPTVSNHHTLLVVAASVPAGLTDPVTRMGVSCTLSLRLKGDVRIHRNRIIVLHV